MAVIAMCVVLVVIGAEMVVRWGGVSYDAPEARPDDSYWLAHFFTALGWPGRALGSRYLRPYRRTL